MELTKEKITMYQKELCSECPDAPMDSCPCGCLRKAIYNALCDAADNIENLKSELEQVKRERDGLLIYFENMSSKPDCNTCIDKECVYRPRPGETVRANCPMWHGISGKGKAEKALRGREK